MTFNKFKLQTLDFGEIYLRTERESFQTINKPGKLGFSTKKRRKTRLEHHQCIVLSSLMLKLLLIFSQTNNLII